MPGQWSTEEIKQLICEVEERPTLWNVLVDEYRDRVKKSDSWKQVAEALNKEQCEVEKKFHTLRTQYAAEVKAEEKRKSGSEGVVKKSKWQYMEALSFLGVGMKKRQRIFLRGRSTLRMLILPGHFTNRSHEILSKLALNLSRGCRMVVTALMAKSQKRPLGVEICAPGTRHHISVSVFKVNCTRGCIRFVRFLH
ncbi:uncharacterized protein LOC135477472 [Liolophura sinensis]|uniref:uncharacterized protein LOC135477472 n=1 Tax=Liolophura sinensis TaxID=3198878 RepID=UPI0031587E4E